MKPYERTPVPHLLELKKEIKTNSKQWSLETIDQTEHSLHSILCSLKKVRNSKLRINKLRLDILHNIFTLAVYTSSSPGTTAINISHVSHHWRKSALGWPALWAFLDLNKAPSIVRSFMKRSQNVPLMLSWEASQVTHLPFVKAPSEWFFKDYACSILPRLCSLTVITTYSDFEDFHHVIQSSKLPPLSLRHLHIRLFAIPKLYHMPVPPPLTHFIDDSCLQEIQLDGLDLPWLELPHNKLTHLTLNPINPPALSQLLVFLSNCPVLKVLKLVFQDKNNYGTGTTFRITTTTSPSTTNGLVLNLTRLDLRAGGPRSYDFIRQFPKCIRTSEALSQFELCHDHLSYHDRLTHSPPLKEADSHLVQEDIVPTLPIPMGTLSHFSNCRYLDIGILGPGKWLKVCLHTSASEHRELDSSCPFLIRKMCTDWAVGCFVIFELARAMPQIQHLKSRHSAWEMLMSKNLDIRSVFPCLDTLEFAYLNYHHDEFSWNSLPTGLRLKTLILDSCTVTAAALVDIVLKTGVEVLELKDSKCRNKNQDEDVDFISALCEWGIDVIWKQSDHPERMDE